MKSLKEKFGKFAISQQELQTAQGGLGPRPCGSPTPPPCHQHVENLVKL